MGDKIELKEIEVIQDGLFQLDFHNENKNTSFRVFVEPEKLLTLMGKAMQVNYQKYWDKIYAEQSL
ncbi:MAG: hypothetical protein WC123_08195 [Bacilli bacterium]